MKDGPVIASVGALIGDPARANILTALMDGRALTASELAQAAGVAPPTASGHLAKLVNAQLPRSKSKAGTVTSDFLALMSLTCWKV